ncbi:MFS transporter [Metabacillus herbersteinensis]|uniref:MFS transporter n=1 Tax=Metabacillus herbersteinensis TaxID=283816 RepID=A0ABV6GJ58_9BACI
MQFPRENNILTYSFIGMLTTIVVLAFARLSYGVVLPFMRDGLQITYKEAGFLGTTTSLGYLCTIMFAGVCASKWGGKNTVLLGISLVSLGLIGLAFTPTYWVTFLFMILLGVGTSFTYTPLISLLVAWFPEQKGLVIGLTTSGVGIGILFTGIIVPYLNDVFLGSGWRISWGLFAIISLVVGLLTFLFIKNPPIMLASEKDEQASSPSEVYKNKDVINVGLIYGVIGVAYIVQMIFIMSFMIDSGVSVALAGQLIALNGILSIFSGPIWGFISDKIGRRSSLILTMGITLFAILLPVFSPTLIWFIIHIVILSCTLTGLFTLVQASSMDHVKPADMPLAFSYATFYFAIGQFVGPTIAGWLIDDYGGFRSAFLFSAVCLVFGLLLTFKVKGKSTLVSTN